MRSALGIGILATLVATATAALNATICESLDFANAPVIAMGRTPMTLKSLVQGDAVCFQVTLADASAKWVSIAISPTAKMVNEPINNVVVYDVTLPPALLYTMRGYEKHDTLPLADQSPLLVSQSSSVNGVITLTFQRKLAAVVSSDVAIDPTGVTILTWATAALSSSRSTRPTTVMAHCRRCTRVSLPLAFLRRCWCSA
ncbi:hypothetical protein SDRG_16467 [Saprolegnia diclina VS20]|uniref:DOMON domain-containing protein n=1 Tax=Saprolegnia diclina (strain VS20) TaxID=1156394 RepID=T0R860_SAPDV|nr:hypothetical protein SDRG_16467 [Saprolegnia diclina VS20]EQC25682.1 hypothetical protein SDRG_16467 [Saprolegnia diclina VS20]|eukprot:XP_008620901.1 hypothetical protein SDRG_16467 [Saprolegnia diclina VS20]